MLNTSNLKELTHYNPLTGSFTWSKIDTPNQTSVGCEIGSIAESHGNFYRITSFNGSYTRVHRIIFLYMTGELPLNQIDHIDGNGLNNKWDNIRHVTNSVNMKNKKKYSNNKSGLSGVRQDKASGKYLVRISDNKKRLFIGSFSNYFDACCARLSAENRLGYHQNHGR
jgi:hypothetical protein